MSLTATPAIGYPLAVATIPMGYPAATATDTVTFYAVASHLDYILFDGHLQGSKGTPTDDPSNRLSTSEGPTAVGLEHGTAYFQWISQNGQVAWGYSAAGLNSVATTLTPPAQSTPIITTSIASSAAVTNPSSHTSGDPPPVGSPSGSISSTPSSTTPAKSVSKTGGVSKGAAAGIAIGCLLAGALIAGLIVWFCLGRKRRRRAGVDGESSAIALMGGEKGVGAKVRSLDSSSPVSQIAEAGLPQPIEDKAISGEISKISNLIKNHVQSFYHTGRSAGLLDLDDLQPLGNDLPLSTGTLSTLLGNADTREIALRFCIAWVIISRMQSKGSPAKSLLPPEVAESFHSMAVADRASRVQTGFLAKWRMLTAELMQSTYVQNAFSSTDRRTFALEGALNDLEGILVPFIDSRMDKKQRRQNLEELLKRSAKFAFTLFSQPSTWDFDWQDHQGVASGSLCIFPALVQTTDESGEAIRPPRAFSEAVVRRLDG